MLQAIYCDTVHVTSYALSKTQYHIVVVVDRTDPNYHQLLGITADVPVVRRLSIYANRSKVGNYLI